MTKLDRTTLRSHEEKILISLVDFYYESGHQSENYRNDESGGIYEHKLAHKLGYELNQESRTPPEFIEACRMLEANGFVRRRKRRDDFPELGIWPTIKGLDRVEYLKSGIFGKARHQLVRRWPQILTSAVTTIVTLTIAWVFGLFGLG